MLERVSLGTGQMLPSIEEEPLGTGQMLRESVRSPPGTGQRRTVGDRSDVVPILDLWMRKTRGYRQRSKIENEDEDDWRLHGTKHTVVAEGTPEEAPNRKYYLVF
jgi:hypothetical protein